MKKIVLAFLLTVSVSSHADKPQGHLSRYVGTLGMGITVDPTLFMLSPWLEYLHSPNFSYGGLVQLGISSGVLMTGSGTVRWRFPIRYENVWPVAEGGFGMAFASGGGTSVGVHILAGGGVDYRISNDVTLGTDLRLNFAPPLDTFFLSWSILQARVYL